MFFAYAVSIDRQTTSSESAAHGPDEDHKSAAPAMAPLPFPVIKRRRKMGSLPTTLGVLGFFTELTLSFV